MVKVRTDRQPLAMCLWDFSIFFLISTAGLFLCPRVFVSVCVCVRVCVGRSVLMGTLAAAF